MLTSDAFRAVKETPETTRCFLTLNLHGVFLHRFDLRMFPFDKQTLAVTMYFWHSPLGARAAAPPPVPPEAPLSLCRLCGKRGARACGRARDITSA